MTAYPHCPSGPASAAQFCDLWSDRMDALDRHLSINTWALKAVAVVLMAYPIVRIAIAAILPNMVVPEVVRTVLNFI